MYINRAVAVQLSQLKAGNGFGERFGIIVEAIKLPKVVCMDHQGPFPLGLFLFPGHTRSYYYCSYYY